MSATPDWVEIVLGDNDPKTTWLSIFDNLKEVAMSTSKASSLDRATVVPDRLLAETAWNLWSEFPQYAPTVIDELKNFWVTNGPDGTAVLLLDALSLRQLPMLIQGAADRQIVPTRIEARGIEIPTQTNTFAAALGISSRSKLFNNSPPGTFIFQDTYTDVLESPFPDCVSMIPPDMRVFVWHKWPDEPLVHMQKRKEDGPELIEKETRSQLTSDGFWELVNKLRQGRRLVISSDHGYAVSKSFSSEMKDPDSIRLLRSTFGAERNAKEDPLHPWPSQHLPPLVCTHDGYVMVTGQRKWTVQGGFPFLCHGGLSLLEAVVPYVEFPAL